MTSVYVANEVFRYAPTQISFVELVTIYWSFAFDFLLALGAGSIVDDLRMLSTPENTFRCMKFLRTFLGKFWLQLRVQKG